MEDCACDIIILEAVFAVMIAGAVAPSRAVGQMHTGSICLSALLRLGDSISVVHFYSTAG